MTTTQLEHLVQEVVAVSMRQYQGFRRAIGVPRDPLRDLLLEKEFRERMRVLLRRAFDRALGELSDPSTEE
jgi:hypothetical protein